MLRVRESLNTERLAAFVVETAAADINERAILEARHALLDTVGCTLAGASEPAAMIAALWVQQQGAEAHCPVWGTSLATSAADAAFANSVASHVLDFDDSMSSLRGHPSATLVPTVLAVAQVARSSGRETLEAYVLGLEVAGKLGRAIGDGHYLRGWHTTATIGAFAAAAAAGRLWRLTVGQMQTALGLAASQAAGLVRNFGTMTKSFHAGSAARSGIISAWFAAHGFTASSDVLDGRDSFLAIYGGAESVPALDSVLDRLGTPWEILDPGLLYKRWPCCFANHRPIGGMLALINEHGITAGEVEAVEVGFLPGGDSALVSREPNSGLEAKFSIEYVAAATLLDGKITLASFADDMVQRAAVRALMSKVRRYRIESDGIYSGLTGYTDVAIVTGRGHFGRRVDRTPGSHEWPASVDERIAKFMDNAQHALDADATRALRDGLIAFDTLPDVSPVMNLTRVGELAAEKAVAS